MNDTSKCGDMWSFLSAADEDLNDLIGELNQIPLCNTKKEIIDTLRRSRSKIETMMTNVKKAGTDYMLKEAEE